MSILQRYHGGFCCGMTHIHGFPANPAQVLPYRALLTPEQVAERTRQSPGETVPMNDEYPEQTGAQRLKMMVANIEEGIPYDHTSPERLARYRAGRARGIIELVLNTRQIDAWRETVETLGFREVNSSVNSNSNQTIYVFHRNSNFEG